MKFIPWTLKPREAKRRKYRDTFASYLKERIQIFQDKLEGEQFEDDEEAIKITQHVQRLRMVLNEVEKANARNQGM